MEKRTVHELLSWMYIIDVLTPNEEEIPLLHCTGWDQLSLRDEGERIGPPPLAESGARRRAQEKAFRMTTDFFRKKKTLPKQSSRGEQKLAEHEMDSLLRNTDSTSITTMYSESGPRHFAHAGSLGGTCANSSHCRRMPRALENRAQSTDHPSRGGITRGSDTSDAHCTLWVEPELSLACTAHPTETMHKRDSRRCGANWFLNRHSAENRWESFGRRTGTWETTRKSTCSHSTGL